MEMEIIQSVQNRIYLIRGQRVILDKDIAFLYETETKSLNLSVKRHIDRFPLDFMFQLTKEEIELLRLQKNQDNEIIPNLRFQIETSSLESWGGTRYLPYAFTEQGVAMLSGIINSKKAIQMNIAIMRAFVELRRVLLIKSDFKLQLDLIKDRLSGYDAQLNQIYDAIENIMDETAAKNKWDNRTRIGFTKGDNT
jgi:phage regulator Rha-like protein